MLKRLGPMPIHAPMFANFFAAPLQKGFHLHLCLEAIQTHHAGCGTWRWEQRRKGCLPIHRPAGERWGPEMRVALGTVVYCGILWYLGSPRHVCTLLLSCGDIGTSWYFPLVPSHSQWNSNEDLNWHGTPEKWIQENASSGTVAASQFCLSIFNHIQSVIMTL